MRFQIDRLSEWFLGFPVLSFSTGKAVTPDPELELTNSQGPDCRGSLTSLLAADCVLREHV